MNKNYKKECVLVSDVFDNGETGKRFFEYLRNFLLQGVADPEKSSSHAFFNEGKREIIRILFEMADKGRKIKS